MSNINWYLRTYNMPPLISGFCIVQFFSSIILWGVIKLKFAKKTSDYFNRYYNNNENVVEILIPFLWWFKLNSIILAVYLRALSIIKNWDISNFVWNRLITYIGFKNFTNYKIYSCEFVARTSCKQLYIFGKSTFIN